MRATIGLTALCMLALPIAACAQPVPPTQDPATFLAAGEDAPLLQGELSVPQRPNADALVPGVVICHPNPLMGGSMYNNVTLAIRDRCLGLGMATLIFNFRGVGRSQGEMTDGPVCADDVLGALAFLRAQPAVDGDRCGLAGYSYGSQMALAAMHRDPTVLACAAISLPTGLEQPVTVEDFAYLDGIERPLLFVTGTDDRYSSVPNILALVDHYHLHARVIPVEGIDHFYGEPDKLALMATQVGQFLAMKLVGEL